MSPDPRLSAAIHAVINFKTFAVLNVRAAHFRENYLCNRRRPARLLVASAYFAYSAFRYCALSCLFVAMQSPRNSIRDFEVFGYGSSSCLISPVFQAISKKFKASSQLSTHQTQSTEAVRKVYGRSWKPMEAYGRLWKVTVSRHSAHPINPQTSIRSKTGESEQTFPSVKKSHRGATIAARRIV
ncbi:MAG: hypothetical protein QOJ40_75 [Verrucomicrobiota bacterium]